MKVSHLNMVESLYGLAGNPSPVVSQCQSLDEIIDELLNNHGYTTGILDHTSFEYIYMSDSICNITGIDANIWLRDGMETVKEIYPLNQFPLYYRRFVDLNRFNDTVPIEERSTYIYSLNYPIKKPDGSMRWLLNEMILAKVDETGNTMYSISNIADITSFIECKDLELKIGRFENGVYKLKFHKRYFPEEREIKLSYRETEILKMIASGYTSQQIADRIYISRLTVNTHRQNMLFKTQTNTPAELVYKAKDQGVI